VTDQQPRVPVDGARKQAAEREAGECACPPSFMRQRKHHPRCPVQPPAHNAGPSVAEAAAQDRAHWTAKYAGEGQ
jgi:hypothetical protein